jgi:PKD repeat protein
VITFNAAGVYTISLFATNTTGTNTSVQQVTVAACTAPQVNFGLPSVACTNYSFAVTNTSTGAPAPTYSWSVLPATNVTISPSPVAGTVGIRAASVGVYTITLTGSSPAGSASSTQTISVSACPPVASFTIPSSFTYCPTDPNAPVNFSTTSSFSNPPGTTGSMTYTWSLSPNTGMAITPNVFVSNVVLTPQSNHAAQYTVTVRVRNASGTSTVTQVVSIIDCGTGVGMANASLNSQLAMYPNPVKDQLNIELPASADSYNIKITNVLGTVVHQEATSKRSASINMASLAKGVYFITVESKTEQVTKKIVLE